jgi:hypothetical protein
MSGIIETAAANDVIQKTVSFIPSPLLLSLCRPCVGRFMLQRKVKTKAFTPATSVLNAEHTSHRLQPSNVQHGFGECFRRFLRQIMSDAAADYTVLVMAARCTCYSCFRHAYLLFGSCLLFLFTVLMARGC